MNPTATVEAPGRLSAEWSRWLAENLMLGMDATVLIEVLASAGQAPQETATEVQRLLVDPAFEAGRWIAERLRKTESLLGVYHDLSGLADPPGTIERRTQVTADEFVHRYAARNRPVVLTGGARQWPAVNTWTPAYLREHCGDETVEVMIGREADRHYEVKSEQHKRRMRFAAYVDMVIAADSTNDHYLVANNHFLDLPGTRHLLDDLQPLPGFLDREQPTGSVFLWFGPAGTVTPLHHDTLNVLLVQILGRKQVTLIPSVQLPLMYNDVAVYSAVDLDRPDPDQKPLFDGAERIEVLLDAGDALFIPVGWWHHVRSLDTSISTSFTSFTFPNDYRWYHPDIQR